MWDGPEVVKSLTKNNPACVTGAHTSMVGHITPTELRRYLNATETANGFGNRILWLAVRRSQFLPEGGCVMPTELDRLQRALAVRLEQGRKVQEMVRDESARQLWQELYPELNRERTGLVGERLARTAPQVLRLALLYALLAERSAVSAADLQAAVAFWDYCERSVGYLFGDAVGDPLADEVLRVVRANHSHGITRTGLLDYFQRNLSASKIGAALQVLVTTGAVRQSVDAETGGRPAERFVAVVATGDPPSRLLHLAGLS
jgi:hypothetical protein